MERKLFVMKKNRENYAKLFLDFDSESRNLVPDGFNNSIHWNEGHGLVTTSILLIHYLA